MGIRGWLRIDPSNGGWREDRKHKVRTKSRAPAGRSAGRYSEARPYPQARSVRSQQSEQPAIGLACSSRHASAVLSDQSKSRSTLAVVTRASEMQRSRAFVDLYQLDRT